MSAPRLQDRICVVTGGGSGLGRAISLRFADEGGHVVIGDVDAAGAEKTAIGVRERGRKAVVRHCDVTKLADIDALIRSAADELGRVDVVVANAGVVEHDTDCLTMTEAQWDHTIDVNLKGVFFTLQAGAKRMAEQGGGGRLIAIASIMAEWGSGTSPAYTASKGGVRQLVRSMGIAVGPLGITCNGIGPGFIETNMTQFLRDEPAMADYLIDRTPVGRIGRPEDIAAVAAFLAGDDASFMNGTVVYPDGGITAGLYSQAVSIRATGEE